MDIEIFRNRSYPIEYKHTDPSGNPVSLEDCTLYFTVKDDQWTEVMSDTDAVIRKTVLPNEHTDAAGGITHFLLNDRDTNVDPESYYYDVIIEKNGLAYPPSLYGRFKVVGTPTNRNVGNE